MRNPKVRSVFVVAVCLCLIALYLPALTVSAQDDNAEITLWIDSTRQQAYDLYKKAFPDKAAKIKVETVDRAQFPAKVLFFNNAGKGWPDVVFAEPDLVAQVADASRNFPLDLTPYVSKDILGKFAPGANAPCTTPDGKLICLRNDLAHNVLWYDKPLMDKFGYKVPTTWEEYLDLGLKVGKEHPGYLIGAFGDDQAMSVYLWASRCPTGQLKDAVTVYINMADPKCKRAVDMVDQLLAAGVLAKVDPFDPAFVKMVTDGKLLMLPAASWYGEYVFGGKSDSLYYKAADGRLGVAAPPKWKDEDKAWTGAQGGSSWTVSRHTLNPKLATDFVIWVTTDNAYQGAAPTFPAYLPAADVWAKTIASNKVYAQDPFPLLKETSSLIDPLWGNVRYDRADAFKTTVIAAVKDGKTVASALDDFQNQLVNVAQAQGYNVVTTP